MKKILFLIAAAMMFAQAAGACGSAVGNCQTPFQACGGGTSGSGSSGSSSK